MIVYIQGTLGSGKTALMTFLGFLGRKDYEVWANYRLNPRYFPDYVYVEDIETLAEMLNYEENLDKPRLLLGDELWAWIDSRTPTKKETRNIINNFLLTSRKKGFHVIHTGQTWTLPDVRLRTITDYVMFPQIYGIMDNKGMVLVDDFSKMAYGKIVAEIYNYQEKRFVKTITIDGKVLYHVFKMYNTREIVRPKRK